MARDTDVTIFGATGFTGLRVAAESVRSMPPDIRSATIFYRSTTLVLRHCAEYGNCLRHRRHSRVWNNQRFLLSACRITLAGRSSSKLLALAQRLGSNRVKVSGMFCDRNNTNNNTSKYGKKVSSQRLSTFDCNCLWLSEFVHMAHK